MMYYTDQDWKLYVDFHATVRIFDDHCGHRLYVKDSEMIVHESNSRVITLDNGHRIVRIKTTHDRLHAVSIGSVYQWSIPNSFLLPKLGHRIGSTKLSKVISKIAQCKVNAVISLFVNIWITYIRFKRNLTFPIIGCIVNMMNHRCVFILWSL